MIAEIGRCKDKNGQIRCGQLFERRGFCMGELVRHILTFVVLITVLKGLISNEEYRQYFHFFSGMVMIVLLCEPLLSFFGGDVSLYRLIEDTVMEENIRDKIEEIKLADGKMEEVIRDSCREAVAEQVHVIAEREGFVVGDVDVRLSQNTNNMEVTGIVVKVAEGRVDGENTDKADDGDLTGNAYKFGATDDDGDADKAGSADKSSDLGNADDGAEEYGGSIKHIEIENIAPVEKTFEKPVSETFENTNARQLTGKKAVRLKNMLREYYLLNEGAVEIWKY